MRHLHWQHPLINYKGNFPTWHVAFYHPLVKENLPFFVYHQHFNFVTFWINYRCIWYPKSSTNTLFRTLLALINHLIPFTLQIQNIIVSLCNCIFPLRHAVDSNKRIKENNGEGKYYMSTYLYHPFDLHSNVVYGLLFCMMWILKQKWEW